MKQTSKIPHQAQLPVTFKRRRFRSAFVQLRETGESVVVQTKRLLDQMMKLDKSKSVFETHNTTIVWLLVSWVLPLLTSISRSIDPAVHRQPRKSKISDVLNSVTYLTRGISISWTLVHNFHSQIVDHFPLFSSSQKLPFSKCSHFRWNQFLWISTKTGS